MTDPDQISTFLLKQLDGSITAAEQEILVEWQRSSPAAESLLDDLQDEDRFSVQLKNFHPDNWQAANSRIRARVDAAVFQQPVRRVHFLRTAWVRYAAASIILLGAGVYIWQTQRTVKPVVAKTDSIPSNIMSGTQRATLTLADGRTISIDSVANGQLATENGSRIVKEDGGIVYDEQAGSNTLVYNTMTTPRGGQYRITLADGTHAWLNAESAITFPTAFTGNERRVVIKGEVYFDVAKDAGKPFIVNADNRLQVEVLGTQFNVNAYKDEDNSSTTLLEGTVRVKAGGESSVTLKPGQQAQLTNGDRELKVIKNLDLDKVVAWKNGQFNFEGMTLQQSMRQLARWYDIQVVYEQPVKDVRFGGTMKNNLPLSELLHFLESAGLRYRLEGRNTLVILNDEE